MNVFKKIILSITNSKRVKKYIYPYFKLFNNKLSSFLIINFEIPKDISNKIALIIESQPKKYSWIENELFELENRVNIHNRNVNELNRINQNYEYYSIDSILENPKVLENDDFDLMIEAIKYSKRIDSLPNCKVDFKMLSKIINNYNQLCLQNQKIKEYNSILNLGKYHYIDEREKNNINNSIQNIINDIDMDCLFYDFKSHFNLDKSIKDHNSDFIENNINNKLFDSINGCSLDIEQRKSVLTDEVSTLVVAGAGSGKTLTICGKVEYLLKECGISPDDILLLSYSRDSADDLQSKVSKINNKLTVGTFHKMGLSILKYVEKKSFVVEEQYKEIIESFFRDEMKKNQDILNKILSFYALYSGSNKHEQSYSDKGEMYEELKKQDFRTIRDQLRALSNDENNKETIKKELVKSFEELAIANWYFINGINYKYEEPYEIDVSTLDKRQYLPDFYLPEYGIYHEHYGINKNFKATQYKDEEAANYVKNMMWKRNLHIENNTTCIESYSWQFNDGIIFEKLEEALKNRGVKFTPLSKEEVYNALDSIYEGQTFSSLITLIRTFLSLYKSIYRNNRGFEELKKYQYDTEYQNKRAHLFLEIVEYIYSFYMSYIREKGKIDFDDMILRSTALLDKCPNFKYKYIIVDEFQDISFSRMTFLKKLVSHGNSKLFAVGDDWQAIYRFSGCDLNIFLNFPHYFGTSEITKITSTHRNSQELQDIAGPFIKRNPEQFDKKINSDKHLKYPVKIMPYVNKKYDALLTILKDINDKDTNANVLLLGRNNKDIESILLNKRIYIDNKNSNQKKVVIVVSDYPNINITFNTVHGSKGLEEDYVIIINADDTRLGFPNKVEDDELLDMVLSSKSTFEYAEERRLWYVALTRTRNYTYIIANNYNPSIFVDEIKEKCFIMDFIEEKAQQYEIKCPYCKSGRLLLRNSEKYNQFYGCSNYPYCNYTIDSKNISLNTRRCKKCGDFMILRKGKFGDFYSCHSFPTCKYTENMNKGDD